MTEKAHEKVVWEIESSHPNLVEPLKAAFSEVVDPELGLNILQLGLVRNVQMLPDHAHITMILTTPFCPYAPAMLDITRQKAEAALKGPVSIEMGMEMWDFSMMEEGAGANWGLY